MEGMISRIEALEVDIEAVKGNLRVVLSQLEGEKTVFLDSINKTFTDHKLVINEVVEGARSEFTNLRASQQALYESMATTVHGLDERLARLEAIGSAAQADVEGWGSRRGYIPTKFTIPKTFTDKEEEWRQWKDDVEDYLDHANPGMRDLLNEIDVEVEDVDEGWRRKRVGSVKEKVLGDHVQVWRALKHLTSGEARKIVMNVKGQDGFRAWQKLRLRFEPSLAAKQGIVLAEFSGMIARPAKTPAETVVLITEMEGRMKNIADLTGDEVSEMHAKSVLVGILDPMTRQHRAMQHGADYEKLKKTVLEFANM